MNTLSIIGCVILFFVFSKPIFLLCSWLIKTVFGILVLPFGLIAIFMYVHYGKIRKMGNPIRRFINFMHDPFR